MPGTHRPSKARDSAAFHPGRASSRGTCVRVLTSSVPVKGSAGSDGGTTGCRLFRAMRGKGLVLPHHRQIGPPLASPVVGVLTAAAIVSRLPAILTFCAQPVAQIIVGL